MEKKNATCILKKYARPKKENNTCFSAVTNTVFQMALLCPSIQLLHIATIYYDPSLASPPPSLQKKADPTFKGSTQTSDTSEWYTSTDSHLHLHSSAAAVMSVDVFQ